MYDILLSDIPEPATLPAIQRYKAKIVRLHARRMEVMLENNAQDKLEDKEPSIFHILKMVKRRETSHPSNTRYAGQQCLRPHQCS